MKTNKTFENKNIGYDINIISREKMAVSFTLHWHRYIEILSIPEDEKSDLEVQVVVDEAEYIMKPGDICFVWPGQLHEIVQNHGKCLMGFQFIPELFSEFSDFDPYRNAMHRMNFIKHDEYPELLESLHIHLNQIMKLQEEKPRFFHIEKIMHLLEFFMELVNGVIDLQETNNFTASGFGDDINWKIHSACNYITNNLSEDIGLDQVAGYVGFSSSYFSRVFKRVTGYGFVEYLLMQRVKRAQTLLSNSDISVLDVSYSAGFRSISTFNRVFKRINGCSPSEYRKFRV